MHILQLTTILSVSALAASFHGANGEDAADMATSPGYFPTPMGGRTVDDDWADAYDKAYAFVSQLTLAEKVNITSGQGNYGLCSGNTNDLPDKNFWGLCMEDGPAGVRPADFVTGFPAGITTSATFNKRLMYQRGKAIGQEFRSKGVDTWLGPVVGPLGSRALSGRNWEGSAADPYISGVSAYHIVRGAQEEGVIATIKHFIANEQETNRSTISSNIDDRTMHEVYVWPFADAVKAGVGSIMCSYNQLNNTHSCQNSYMLNKVLKDELGFQGFVMSDWYATQSGVEAVVSGQDMDMPGNMMTGGGSYFNANLTIGVLNGSIPIDRIDDMATRVMASFYMCKVDEARAQRGPPNFSSKTKADTDYLYSPLQLGPIVTVNDHVDVRTDLSYQVAYNTAVEGVVLLKNDNSTLPLITGSKRAPRRISVLGRAAAPSEGGPDSEGGADFNFDLEAGFTANGVDGAFAIGSGSGGVLMPYFVSPLEAINARGIKERSMVKYNLETTSNSTAFTDAATYSDVNIIFAQSRGGEGYDRANYTLEYNADEIILSAASVNPNNVVVITTVGPVDMEKWIEHPNITAVLLTTPGGQDEGTAIAELLFGDQTPSGRLPFTIAKDTNDYDPINHGDEVAANGSPQDDFPRSLYVDYRYFDKMNITPRYEFGHGLSYSQFELSQLQIRTVKAPSEHLPTPEPLKPCRNYSSEIPTPDDMLFPEGFEQIPQHPYPYLNSTDWVKKDLDFPYPDGYNTVQKNSSSLAGGASGGNPALWEVVYQVRVNVKNTGSYNGGYVPQLYIGYPESDKFPSAPRQLRGFEKVFLQPGQAEDVTFDVKHRDLSVWDVETASWVVQRGEYKVYVGSSSRNLELNDTIVIN